MFVSSVDFGRIVDHHCLNLTFHKPNIVFIFIFRHPISSMIFGTNALITKPAISLSPMLSVAVLNSHGYGEMMEKATAASPELKHVMFILICCYPVFLGTIQYISWSYFKLKTK